MFLLKSLTGFSGQHAARHGCSLRRSRDKRPPRPWMLERLENRLCLATWSECITKRHLPQLLATLAGMMIAFVPCAYADLYVGTLNSNNVLRYDEVTGAFIDTFVSPGDDGPFSARGLIIGHDGNLYISSFNNNRVLRYNATTGDPVPAPGQTGATFVPQGSGGLQGPAGLILGRDGNLYVSSRLNHNVLRYNGTTGDFIDAFVPPAVGGLNTPRALVFGPDGNLYVVASFGAGGAETVLRYDGTTGAPLPAPGQTEAVFASGFAQDVGPGLAFGPDGDLYVSGNANNGVVRFDGATGQFTDIFVSSGSGGLDGPTTPIFGPDNNLYVNSQNNNSVLRYDGRTGAFIDAFVPSGSGGLNEGVFLIFTRTDPTTLAYVPPPHSRFQFTAPPTAVSGTPFDVTVTALDPSGNIDTNYQGTVIFSTSDLDPGVALPADYTFTTGDGGDNGVHTFSGGVVLVTVGAQTLTGTDTLNGISGSATVTVGPGP
jgi:streptogramin lyase